MFQRACAASPYFTSRFSIQAVVSRGIALAFATYLTVEIFNKRLFFSLSLSPLLPAEALCVGECLVYGPGALCRECRPRVCLVKSLQSAVSLPSNLEREMKGLYGPGLGSLGKQPIYYDSCLEKFSRLRNPRLLSPLHPSSQSSIELKRRLRNTFIRIEEISQPP